MKNLKTFESFLIPKPIRKFMPGWSDEDIAIQVLKELKAMKGNHQKISKLGIVKEAEWFKFNLDGFDFKVTDRYFASSKWDIFLMNDQRLSASREVCKKIVNVLQSLLKTSENEIAEFDKKDFRMRMKNKK